MKTLTYYRYLAKILLAASKNYYKELGEGRTTYNRLMAVNHGGNFSVEKLARDYKKHNWTKKWREHTITLICADTNDFETFIEKPRLEMHFICPKCDSSVKLLT